MFFSSSQVARLPGGVPPEFRRKVCYSQGKEVSVQCIGKSEKFLVKDSRRTSPRVLLGSRGATLNGPSRADDQRHHDMNEDVGRRWYGLVVEGTFP